MVKLIDFNDMVGERLGKVLLKPFNSEGKIELFGDFTHRLARELYEFDCRYYGFDPKVYDAEICNRDMAHYSVEHLAKLGALAYRMSSTEGNVYEIGCGIALPSIAYSLLSRCPITVVDKDEAEIDIARKLAQELGADLEFVVGQAEDFIAERGLKPSDVLILSKPDGFLRQYWQELLQEHDFIFLFTDTLRINNNGIRYSREEIEAKLDPLVERIFTGCAYNVNVGYPSDDSANLVFLAQKSHE